MDLDEFLELNGADAERVVAGARALVELGPEDRLIAVGSLAEGLGNRKSDVDLLLLTPRADHGDASPDEVRSFVAGRSLIDLRIVPASVERRLRERLSTWAAGCWNLTVAADFTASDLLLLHRLGAGRVLWPDRPAQDDDRRTKGDVAKLKLHIARHMARTVQVDMAGYREEGDTVSMVYAAQDLLGHAADGLLAGFGLTNPTPKWRNRLLDRLPADWEDRLVVRRTGLRPNEVYWRLHRAPAEATPGAALAHASRIVAFARAAFHWAEERLVHGQPDARVHRASSPPADPAALPFLDLDVDFHRIEQGVMIGRLNEFGATMEMSLEQFATLLLLESTASTPDGRPGASGAETTASMAGFIAAVREAGFQIAA